MTFSPPGGMVLTNPHETFYICPACARDETRREHAMVRYDWNRTPPWGWQR